MIAVDRLAYGLRTAAGAALALAVAWAGGLEHPQWAGMTVWAASQPVRAHLVEKSLFRGLGTMAGAIFGVLLTALAAQVGSPAVLVVGVALWLGACAAAGNLLRGFAAYGAMLAGFSAVMVALLDSGHPESVLALGLDRTATVLIGVGVALGVGLLLSPRQAEDDVPRDLRLAGAALLEAIAAQLRHPAPADRHALHRQLSELARLDDAIDAEGSGSLAARREASNRRRALMALVGAVAWRDAAPATADPGLGDGVAAAAADFAAHVAAPERRVTLARLARAAEPGLRRVLAELGAALPRGRTPPEPELPLLRLHRDWPAAREAGVRAAAVMLILGAIWVATGWAGGPLMMLGASIMISVFSTAENPFAILPKVAVGQAMGVAGAFACRWLVWPHLGSEAGLVLAILPFVLLGGVLTGMPRFQAQAFDYNMVLLLLLQPGLPLTGSVPHSLMIGGAVVSGPLVAWVAFRLIHPPSAARRRAALIAAMAADVEAMAAHPSLPRAVLRRARLRHRLLRLVRSGDRAGSGPGDAALGLALLQIGRATLRLESREGRESAARESAAAGRQRALARIATLRADPLAAAEALEALAGEPGRDAPVLRAAAAAARAESAAIAAAR